MRRSTRIASTVLQGVVVVVALATAVLLVVPRLLGWQVLPVMSGSMAPTYDIDSVLTIAHVDPTDIRVGDVIAFEAESDRPMVTHRVIAIERDSAGLTFVTKGDANEDPDTEPVAASAVRGRVIFGVPHLGLFVRAVREPLGFVAFIVLPCLLLIVQEILTMRRGQHAKKAVASDLTEERLDAELDREVLT